MVSLSVAGWALVTRKTRLGKFSCTPSFQGRIDSIIGDAYMIKPPQKSLKEGVQRASRFVNISPRWAVVHPNSTETEVPEFGAHPILIRYLFIGLVYLYLS